MWRIYYRFQLNQYFPTNGQLTMSQIVLRGDEHDRNQMFHAHETQLPRMDDSMIAFFIVELNVEKNHDIRYTHRSELYALIAIGIPYYFHMIAPFKKGLDN